MRKGARPTKMAEETPEFKAFWELWKPHMHVNDGRGLARDEFFFRVEQRGADPQDIVDGTRWFIRSGGNQGTDYQGNLIRCHAQTWLGRGAYEDGCESERAFQAKQAEKANNVVPMIQTPKSKWLQEWEANQKREA